MPSNARLTLVLAPNGNTGRRVTDRLKRKNVPLRLASRSAETRFDWEKPATWPSALDGIRAVYIAYVPDLAVPAAAEAIEAFSQRAVRSGVERMVLLSGRGEPAAQRCEQIVLNAGVDATVVRARRFNQNFSEGPFHEMVMRGSIRLPGQAATEPFVDAEDIADVAAAALTEPMHADEVYEVTGPRLLSFAEVAGAIGEAIGRHVAYRPLTLGQFGEDLEGADVPRDYAQLLMHLFSEVLDGRNANLGDGVERALGRPPRDFSDFVQTAAAGGVWSEEFA